MLILNVDELVKQLEPVLRGDVGVAGFDTETTEVPDDRFTPYGTDVRMAGFSMSFNKDTVLGTSAEQENVDLYAAVRHSPYDWRRPHRLIPTEWADRLIRQEGVQLDGTWAPSWNPNLPLDEVRDVIRAAFRVRGVRWIAHNWPFDAKIVTVDGIELPDEMEDTQIDSVFTDERPLDLWDEENKRFVHQGHGLKHLCEVHLGIAPDEKNLLDLARKVLECNSWAHLPLRTIVAPYACRDTRDVLDLAAHVRTRPLWGDAAIQELIRKHHAEMRHLLAMEGRGIKVDVAACAERARDREVQLPAIQARVTAELKLTLNLASPTEVAAQLYGPLGFPKYRGKDDTEKSTLKQVRALVAGGAPCAIPQDQALALLDAILEYRKAQKELTAFYRPLVEFADGESTIFTVLNALRAATTRMSASKPNIQQMQKPKKGKESESVRYCFKPRDGHVFITPDYSQQELRVAGHFALAVPSDFQYLFSWGCTLKKRGDCKGRGPHGEGVVHTGNRGFSTATAPDRMALVEGFMSADRAFDPHQIMADAANVDRDRGKTADFALIYGAFYYKLAETLDCTVEEAKRIYDAFWKDAFPELAHVKTFIGERLRNVGPQSYYSHQKSIRTLHGGRIHLAGAHKGFNYIVQRSCREILLNAVLAVGDVIRNTPYRMLFPVHDELVLECPSDSLDQGVVYSICKAMVEAGSASRVPMVVEPNVCRANWAEKEALPLEWGYNGVLAARASAS